MSVRTAALRRQVSARIQRAITLRAISEFQFCRLGDKRAGETPAPLQT
jgi:hypothetical protein